MNVIKPTVLTTIISTILGTDTGATLAFHALDTSAGVHEGTGGLTCTHPDTLYAYDHTSGVYEFFAANEPIWVDDASGNGWLVYYPAATNSQKYSNDLTNAEWTATNVTVAKDETGIEGSVNGACTLTATAGNGTVIANAITDAADDQSTCWYLKRKTGTGNIDITLDNGSTWTTVTLTASFQKFTVDQATLANPQIGIRIVTSGDAVVCGNAEAHTGKPEAEVRGLGPIFTTSAAVSVGATSYSFDADNQDRETAAWFYEFVPTVDPQFQAGREFVDLTDINNSSGFIMHYQRWLRSAYINTSDGQTTKSWAADVWSKDTPEKTAVVYSTAEAKINANRDGAWYAENTDFKITKSTFNGLYFGGDASRCAAKIRNLRRYDIADYQEGTDTIDELMAYDPSTLKGKTTAWYDFDGDLTDSHGSGDMTDITGITFVDGAADVDSDRATVAAGHGMHGGARDFSVYAEVSLDNATGYLMFCGDNPASAAAGDWGLWVNSSRVRFSVHTGGSWNDLDTVGLYPDGTPIKIVATYKSSEKKMTLRVDNDEPVLKVIGSDPNNAGKEMRFFHQDASTRLLNGQVPTMAFFGNYVLSEDDKDWLTAESRSYSDLA